MNSTNQNATTPEIVLKGAATSLTKFLAEKGHDIGHATALEGLAKSLGVRNYRTLKAMLSKTGDQPELTNSTLWLNGVKTLTVFVAGIAPDFDSNVPSVAKFELTPEFLQKLRDLTQTVKNHGLTWSWTPAEIEWESAARFGIKSQELWISANSFHWCAGDGCGNKVSSLTIRLEDLEKEVAKACDLGNSEIAFGLSLPQAHDYFKTPTVYENYPTSAFEISELDIERVLHEHAMRVANSDGLPFAIMAERIYADMSDKQLSRIAKAAVEAGTDMSVQTTAAENEIFAILHETGVLS